MRSDFEKRLAQANGRLKAARLRVQLLLRGNRLWLQATLPPKPHSLKLEQYQQRINLDVDATPQGLSIAETQARKIGALLACGEFTWQESHTPISIGELVQRFEADYFNQNARNPKSQTTFDKDYLAVLKRLPSNQPLTSQAVFDLVSLTAPDSRQRKRFCLCLSVFCRFAGLDIDLTKYKGKYSAVKAKSRDLPSDALIQEWFYKFKNPYWQWVYGVIATYGLRPHEAWYLDMSRYPIATVTDGKTGARIIYPYYPEWADLFSLAEAKPPSINAKNNTGYGCAAGQYCRRNLSLPFPLYDLRHAWARRTIEFGLDISLSAKQMGHSLAVHSNIYHHWIGDDIHQRAFDLMMQRTDRPTPPLS
jgi:integrase